MNRRGFLQLLGIGSAVAVVPIKPAQEEYAGPVWGQPMYGVDRFNSSTAIIKRAVNKQIKDLFKGDTKLLQLSRMK